MRGKFLSLFTFLLHKLPLIENTSAFNTSENIRSKELSGTPINNSVTYFDSFLIRSISIMGGNKTWNKILIFSQQNLSTKWIDHIICTGRGGLAVS